MNEVKVRMLKMEPIKVRCKSCGKEIVAAAGKSVCCGCANMTTIKGDVISAVDLAKLLCSIHTQRRKILVFLQSKLSGKSSVVNVKFVS